MIDAFLAGIGFIPQTTPAGRVIMVSAKFYPLSPEFLADEDAYMSQLVEDVEMYCGDEDCRSLEEETVNG